MQEGDDPFFALQKTQILNTFFIYGTGKGDLLDDVGDGFFDGEKTIFGFELSSIHRYFTLSAGFEVHNITFERLSIEEFGSLTQDFEARNYLFLQLELSVGYGL